MGHIFEIALLVVIGLALFGPKALQSMARDAGKTVSQAKNMKDKLMADLPLDAINKVTNSIPQVPLNSRQALQMLMPSDAKQEPTAKPADKPQESVISEQPVEPKKEPTVQDTH